MKRYSSLILLLTAFITVNGQLKKKFDFGEVSSYELNLKNCDYEPEAAAVVLGNYMSANSNLGELDVAVRSSSSGNGAGNVPILSDQLTNFDGSVTYYYHKRIKIFKKEALDLAKITVDLDPQFKESIIKVKGHTINVSAKGKPVKSVIKKHHLIIDKTDPGKHVATISFPDVHAGSIIEVQYQIRTDNIFNIKTFYFQEDIPTEHAAVHMMFNSQLMDYRHIISGIKLPQIYRNSSVNTWELEYLPSLKNESLVNNYMDHSERISFQLAGYYISKSNPYGDGWMEHVSLATSWEDFGHDQLQKYYYLSRKKMGEDLIAGLNLSDPNLNKWDKVKKIHEVVTRKFFWNGSYSTETTKPLKKLLEERSGNSAEINLLFCLLLNSAGINASPALISTNSNGTPQKEFPLISQFNHVIVNIGTMTNYRHVDGIKSFYPYNLIPSDSQVEEAFVLRKKGSSWASLKPAKNNSRSTTTTWDLTDISQPKLNTNIVLTGHYACKARKIISDNEQEREGVQIVLDDLNCAYKMRNYEVKNLDDLYMPLEITVDFADIKIEGDFINPYALKPHMENPLKEIVRHFPIEFNSPFKEKHFVSIKLPADTPLANGSEGSQIELDGGQGKYKFKPNYNAEKNQLTITTELNIIDPVIRTNNYPVLKKMFSQMIQVTSTELSMK